MLRIGIKPLAGKSEHCIREAVLSASPDTMVADSYHLYLIDEVQRLTSSSKWEISPLDHHIQCSLPLAHQLMLLARWLQHQGFPGGLHGKESAYQAGELGLIPGSGRCPGEGNGNPLQYSCLENPMDRKSWWATVHGVAKRHDQVTNTLIFHYSIQQRALADWLRRSLEKGGQSWCVLFALLLTLDTAHPGASPPSVTLKIGCSMSAIPSDLSHFHTHTRTHTHMSSCHGDP